MSSKGDDNKDSHKDPNSNYEADEDFMAHFPPKSHEQEGMKGDRQDKKSTSGVSYLQPESLEETTCRIRGYFILCNPFDADQECERLLEIGQNEVVDENDILIVTDVPRI